MLGTKIAITFYELMDGHYNLIRNGKTEVQVREAHFLRLDS